MQHSFLHTISINNYSNSFYRQEDFGEKTANQIMAANALALISTVTGVTNGEVCTPFFPRSTKV
jgi:hypothetical protein